MLISHIVAVEKNHGMGFQNQLPWHLPVDLKFFKTTTLNRHILMGRKTFVALGKPLPNRTSLVISRNPSLHQDGVTLFDDIAKGVEFAKNQNETELFIIGGAEIFNQTLDVVDVIYLTRLEGEFECDCFYPYSEMLKNFNLDSSTTHSADEKNKYTCHFERYVRKV
jgi:dihydrofolate reductase